MSSERVPVRLQLVVPCHQPLTLDEEQLAARWESTYAPLLEAIDGHEARVALHLSGHMLDWLARRREDVLLRLKTMAKAQKIEVLGGLFYGAVPHLVSELDARGQVQMMSEFWESLLGWAPQGFWLPELAWASELPRLMQDSGLAYGFVSTSQVSTPGATNLVTLERGEQRLSAFVLEPNLSAALPSRPVDEWVDALLDRASGQGEAVHTVWVRAEQLCGPDAVAGGDWLEAFLTALGGGRPEIKSTLPVDGYAAARPATPVRLSERCAAEMRLGKEQDWPDFVRNHPEAEGVLRHMQRVSDKLQGAIAAMEDEELEESWSDALATAQRLVFSAQAPDAYWTRGSGQGCLDPALRRSTLERLIRAEAMLDALVQGDEDWIGTEEEDLDADLTDEVFVCTRHVTAWVLPALGGRVRGLDLRLAGKSVFDLAPRRTGEVAELKERLLGERASAAELFSSGDDLWPKRPKWEVSENRIDEDGDCNYHLRLSGALPVSGGGRSLTVEKELVVPIDAPELRLRYKLALGGPPEVVMALEAPISLEGPVKLEVNGAEAPAKAELVDVTQLRLVAPNGDTVELSCEPACEVWWQATSGGATVVPVVRLEREAEVSLTWRFLAAGQEVAAATSDEGEEAVEEEEEVVEEEVVEEEETTEEEEVSEEEEQ